MLRKTCFCCLLYAQCTFHYKVAGNFFFFPNLQKCANRRVSLFESRGLEYTNVRKTWSLTETSGWGGKTMDKLHKGLVSTVWGGWKWAAGASQLWPRILLQIHIRISWSNPHPFCGLICWNCLKVRVKGTWKVDQVVFIGERKKQQIWKVWIPLWWQVGVFPEDRQAAWSIPTCLLDCQRCLLDIT